MGEGEEGRNSLISHTSATGFTGYLFVLTESNNDSDVGTGRPPRSFHTKSPWPPSFWFPIDLSDEYSGNGLRVRYILDVGHENSDAC